MLKPNETSMYKRAFTYVDKRFYYVMTGLYKGYLCYTCGDGVIRSEFGNPLNNNYIKNIVPIPIDDAREIRTLGLTKRTKIVGNHKKKLSKKENEK